MSIDSQNLRLRNKARQKQQSKIEPKETFIKIYDLQQYISSIFTNCSMPPLNQFLELGEIDDNMCKVKLQPCQIQLLSEQEVNDYVYFLQSGKILLKKNNELKEEVHQRSYMEKALSMRNPTSSPNDEQPANKEKAIQIKQNSFFMLTNVKKINQVQNYSISSFSKSQSEKCLIGRIKLNPAYSISWYISQSQKYQFLSTFFQTDEFSISQHKLKGLCRFFKLQLFKRGTILTQQSENNQRLYIIKSGECQFSKAFSYEYRNHSNKKIIKVANGGSRAILGSQFLFYQFMGSSKPVCTATRAISETQNKLQRLSLKIEEKCINNFTVSILSGYAEVFHISVAKFKQLCEKYVPEVPQQLRKCAQANYITLLRTTKQKLHVELLKIERNEIKLSQQRAIVQAKMKSGHFQDQLGQTSPPELLNQSPVRLRRSQFIQTNLQGSQVEKIRSKRLQKKIQLLLENKKKPTDYKKKIQIILKQKLNSAKEWESPERNKQENFQIGREVSQIKKDLEGIFMNNQSNYRTNSINRQNQILSLKQGLLKRRYASVENMLIVHQDHYDKQKNKLFRMDLIQRGLKDPTEDQEIQTKQRATHDFSARTKKQCMEKINKANKIKQQFMIIRSQCENCHCYDDIEGYMSTGAIHKGIKEQATKTGSVWRTSHESKNNIYEEPLEKLHSRMKLISQRASRKYHHNAHLLQKKKRFVSGSQRRFSAPLV